MRGDFWIFVVATCAISTLAADAAAAGEPLRLAASSPWNLRYEEDKCRITSKFGTAEEEVTLTLDQSGVEPYYTVTLIGHPVGKANGQFMRIQFGDEARTERSFLKGKFEDKTPLIAMFGVNLAPVPPLNVKTAQADGEVEPIGSAREAAIKQIEFTGGLNRPLTLQTGSLGKPLAAMHECVIDLMAHLGAGEGSDSKLSRVPIPKTSPARWIGPGDYPSMMLNSNEEGLVRFRLTVDSTGTPTSCHITRSTRPQVFDDIVCLALLKRAKFDPALDLEGKPVAAFWHSAVRFEIP